MADIASTKLTIHGNKATGISSSAFGANLDAIGFNLTFIAIARPKLALELMKLYEQANKIKGSDPMPPAEDFDLFSEELKKWRDSSKENS